MFLLAAHTTHRANFERKVPDQLACGQLVKLQNVLDVVEIVDQQVALVHAGGKTYKETENSSLFWLHLRTPQAAGHNNVSQDF